MPGVLLSPSEAAYSQFLMDTGRKGRLGCLKLGQLCGVIHVPALPPLEPAMIRLVQNPPLSLKFSSIKPSYLPLWGFSGGSVVNNLPSIQEMRVQFLGQEDPLEEEMATHSSVLAWRIPGMGEPGGLEPMGSQRGRHDLLTQHSTHAPAPLLNSAEIALAIRHLLKNPCLRSASTEPDPRQKDLCPHG